MTLTDARDRLNTIRFTDMLGGAGLTSDKIVRVIRSVQQNVEKLAAAAFHQQAALEQMRKEQAAQRDLIESYIGLTPDPAKCVAGRENAAQQRVRTSKTPCVNCDQHWTEPFGAGRMKSRCPICR